MYIVERVTQRFRNGVFLTSKNNNIFLKIKYKEYCIIEDKELEKYSYRLEPFCSVFMMCNKEDIRFIGSLEKCRNLFSVFPHIEMIDYKE